MRGEEVEGYSDIFEGVLPAVLIGPATGIPEGTLRRIEQDDVERYLVVDFLEHIRPNPHNFIDGVPDIRLSEVVNSVRNQFRIDVCEVQMNLGEVRCVG